MKCIFSGDLIRGQLEWQCRETAYDPFPCGNESKYCAYRQQVCDGVANCPEGEDEALDLCVEEGGFSGSAIIECPKKNIYNVTLWIKAVPCDGVVECENDEDEQYCSLNDYILILIMGVFIIIFGGLAFILWTAIGILYAKKKPTLILLDFNSLHGTDALKETMFQAIGTINFEDMKTELIDVELDIHEGVHSEVVCCLKVSGMLQSVVV